MNVLILEDDKWRNGYFRREFPTADMAKTVEEFKKFLSSKVYELVFLDHDLGEGSMESGPGTGYEAAMLFNQSSSSGAHVVIHSWNMPGAQNMASVLTYAIIEPFGTAEFVALVQTLK